MADFRKYFIAYVINFLDAVFLEDEKEFIEDIESIVSEVANYEDNSLNFKCSYCSKLCKSKGLSSHVNVKHAALKEGNYASTVDKPLSEEIHSKLNSILEGCAEKILVICASQKISDSIMQNILKIHHAKKIFNHQHQNMVSNLVFFL